MKDPGTDRHGSYSASLIATLQILCIYEGNSLASLEKFDYDFLKNLNMVLSVS